MMRTLSALIAEGKSTHIGLSECNADTLHKAHAVHPITAVKIEVSPFSFKAKTCTAIDTAAELGVSVIAYSPLGRGILTGKIKSTADLQESDIRLRYSRSKAENIEGNLPVVDAVEGWRSARTSPWPSSALRGSRRRARALFCCLDRLSGIIDRYGVKGDRGMGLTDEQQNYWG
ncbi:NADP-dependent oxidoreductase domain-containing protein [Mycena sanguinolenta]|nr:NADP-dependent oxidoreductase domain-containing protein [Mycena sanguinolenta]